MSNTSLPEPAFGRLDVDEGRGQWIESRNGQPDYDAEQMHAHAAAVTREKDARIKVLEGALLKVARMAEALKREYSMDPDSPQAIRNAQYMNISYAARAALGDKNG